MADTPKPTPRVRMPATAKAGEIIEVKTLISHEMESGQRKDASGEKSARLSQITNPSRTVLFLEQGLKGEVKAMPQQPHYDGSPKGSAKTFVARYNGMVVLTFVDGHAEFTEGKDILEENGLFKFPVQPNDIIWSKTAEEDPN